MSDEQIIDPESAALQAEEAAIAAAAPASEVLPAQQVEDKHAYENKLMKMQRILREQPKVQVRIPKDLGPQSVILNGARFNIPAGVSVQVPQSVADAMREAEWI
jgi:hypothetical protein